jgi:hypothetical protein
MRSKLKGWGPWQKRWFSICSKHQDHKEGCHLCDAGHWSNIWCWKISGWMFQVSPRFWRWYMNLPHSRRKFLAFTNFKGESSNPFPNLK